MRNFIKSHPVLLYVSLLTWIPALFVMASLWNAFIEIFVQLIDGATAYLDYWESVTK